MDNYYFYCCTYIANVFLLLLFVATGESMDLDKKTASTSSSVRVFSGKKLVRACFADFLILQLVEKKKMGGESNKKQQFVLNPLLVDPEKVRLFMQANEGKTAELWNCVNNARPFAHKNINGVKKLASLMDIFRKQITRMDFIVPSDNVQNDLHNAQCLLDLGVIEGKILMKKTEDSENYVLGKSLSEWSQELRDFGKNLQKIVLISPEGKAHLGECLYYYKGKKRFSIKKGAKKEQQKLSDEQLLSLLNSIDWEELAKIITKKLVPFSNWLLKQIGLNQRQKQCFADLFFQHFGRSAMKGGGGQKFAVNQFPERESIHDLLANEEDKEESKEFVACLKSASPFPNQFSNPRHVHILVQEFYEKNFNEIVVSSNMHQKIHNAQCWLDLGVLEGKISMKIVQPFENGVALKDDHEGWAPWLAELESEQQQQILVSTEGATFMEGCLRKGKSFDAKLEKIAENQWHLQLLDAFERINLRKFVGQIKLSKWLNKGIFYEQNCVADFLVKHWHAQTWADYFHTDSLTPAKLWRFITWSDLVQNGRPKQIHADDNANDFETLEICLIRKGAVLKLDGQGKQYIDLELLFQFMDYNIFTTQSLTDELNTQSECLANFLAIKSRGQCLLKKRHDIFFLRLTFHSSAGGHKSPYIINYDSEGAYALSAEQCHLPEGESGIYSENSVDSKEREDFKQLWDCGVRMTTTTEQEGGGKTIDVRKLLKIYAPEQRLLRGNLMEIFFSPAEPTLDQSDLCSICHEEYGRIVVSVKRCKHHFHSHCIQDWMRRGHDNCPLCKGPITNIPRDPNGTFDVMIGGWLD